MKQHYLLLSWLLLSITVCAQTSVVPPGNGTYGSPYLISRIEHLYWMSQTPSAWSNSSNYGIFRQVADIDASETVSWNGGQGFIPIGRNETSPVLDQSFFGVYQGQGYSILNLTINRNSSSSSLSSIGLFGSIGGGTISNLKIKNAQIKLTGYNVENIKAGIFCGRMASGSIDQISVSGTVYCQGTPTGLFAGGLAGLTSDVGITKCGANVDVYTEDGTAGGLIGNGGGGRTLLGCYASGTVTGKIYAGGLMGIYYAYGSGIIRESYSNCDVNQGENGSGGLIGFSNGGSLIRCYSSGIVAGSNYSNSGGMIGSGTYNSVNLSYYDESNAGIDKSLAGIPRTPEQLRDIDMFLADTYDFVGESPNGLNDYWVIRADTNNGYPYLKWAGTPYGDNCRIWYGSTNSVFGEPSNWSHYRVPAPGESIMMHHTAVRDLVADGSYDFDVIYFTSSNVKFVLGPWDITARYTLDFHKNAYVKTNGAGALHVWMLTNAPTGYEGQIGIGNSTLNDIVATNNTGVEDDFSFRVLDEVYENGRYGTVKSVLRVKRTWMVNKGSGESFAGNGVGLQFRFQDASIVGGPIGINKPKIYHYTNGAWEVPSSMFSNFSEYPASIGGGGYAGLYGYKGTFSPFSIILPSEILPVQWTSFGVKRSGSNALLNWSTASEQNAKRFVVLYSTNGIDWKEAGVVKATGNSNSISQYQFIHSETVNGKNYYRLRQEDLDGAADFSKIVVLDISATTLQDVKVNGNPVTSGHLQVELSISQEINLLNAAGQVMLRKVLPAGNNTISVAHLTPGTYYLKTTKSTIQILVR